MVTRVNGGSSTPVVQIEAEPIESSIVSGVKESTIEEQPIVSNSGNSSRTAEISLTGIAIADRLSTELERTRLERTEPEQGTSEVQQKNLLKVGSKGPEVLDFQQQMNEWRVRNGKEPITEDGSFGPGTQAAVLEYQRETGLKQDGIVGDNTRARLTVENNKNFLGLPNDTQKQVRDQMNKYQNNPGARENLKKLSTDEDFAKMGRDGQDFALKTLAKKPADKDHATVVQHYVIDRASLENNSEFKKHPADRQAELLKLTEKFVDNEDARAQLHPMLRNPEFVKLSRSHQDQILDGMTRHPTTETHFCFGKMLESDAFKKATDAEKTRMLELGRNAAGQPDKARALGLIISNPKFDQLSPAEKNMALNVLEKSTSKGVEAFRDLLNKEVGGKPALQNKDTSGKTLLETLNRLATTNLDSKVKDSAGGPETNGKVLEGLMQEVNDPDRFIDQGNRGTCGVTVPSHILAEKNPAEYARLVTDISTTGQARMANGSTIQPPGDGFKEDNSGRSVSERLLQSSLMNFAVRDGSYRNNGQIIPDDTVPGGFRRDDKGTSSFGSQVVMEGLFNKKFEGTTQLQRMPPDKIFDKIQDNLKNKKGPVSVAVQWGNGIHEVEVIGINNGRVLFRNPWGPGVARGNTLVPPRTVVVGEKGLESMSESEFKKILLEATLEK